MKVSDIVVLLALSAIAEAQWAAAARNLYQPIILSLGAVFTTFQSKENSEGVNEGWDGPIRFDNIRARNKK